MYEHPNLNKRGSEMYAHVSEEYAFAPELLNASTAQLLVQANELYSFANKEKENYSSKQSSLQQAKVRVEKVLRDTPLNPQALNLLGRINLDSGHVDEASSLFSQCIQIEPDNSNFWMNAGFSALVSKNADHAFEYFKKALDLSPNNITAFLGIAKTYMATKRYDVAYLHFRSLLRRGINSPSLLDSMTQCAAQLEITAYNDDLDRDARLLLDETDVSHARLGQFLARLIELKYKLNEPDASVDLDIIAVDPLVIESVSKCVLPGVAVEELLIALRSTIFNEVCQVGTLRESLQDLIIALGLYGEKTGYVLPTSEEELQQLSQLTIKIETALRNKASTNDITGALLLTSMYSPVFPGPLSLHLSTTELTQWPSKVQPLLELTLYRRLARENVKQNFPEKATELATTDYSVSAFWPRWSAPRFFVNHSLKEDLADTIRFDSSQKDRLLTLVTAADGGQTALEFAKYFVDTDVLGLDNSLDNIAEASLKAKEFNVNNAFFWPRSMFDGFINSGERFDVAVLDANAEVLSHALLSRICNNLVVGGALVISLNSNTDISIRETRKFITENNIMASPANIESIRSTIKQDGESEYWQSTIASSFFYSMEGCKKTWFGKQSTKEIAGHILELMADSKWHLNKALNHHENQVGMQMVQRKLSTFIQTGNLDINLKIYLTKLY